MAINENYHELMDVMAEMFCYIFNGVEKRFAKELDAIRD